MCPLFSDSKDFIYLLYMSGIHDIIITIMWCKVVYIFIFGKCLMILFELKQSKTYIEFQFPSKYLL